MRRVIRLTEKDLTRLVKRILKEGDPGDGKRDDFSEYEGRTDIYADSIDVEKNDDESMTQPVAEYWGRKKRRLQESELMGGDIEKAKACFAKAKLVPEANNRTKPAPFDFPKICESGFSDACVREMNSQNSIFAGNRRKDWSLMNCLLTIKTLKPKLQVYSDASA